MRYKTAERIFDHKGIDSSLPVGTQLVLCSKWYKGKRGRFAMFKAPSFDGLRVVADEIQLTRGK